MAYSLAESVAALPRGERLRLLRGLGEGLLHSWGFWARPEQQTPGGDWSSWLILAGRGFGKTRTGAEYIRERVNADPATIAALIAATAADARDVMVEGPAGILAVCAGDIGNLPVYEPSKRKITWPNGAEAHLYSADEPERLRGPQHSDAWCDELAAWRYPEAAWDNLQFGLRVGDHPRAVVTTTPKPKPLVRAIIKDPTTHATRGSTFDNKANLPKRFLDKMMEKYDGTRLGKQELYAEILEDVPGALWKQALLDDLRVREPPEFRRFVVAVDPAVSVGPDSDETGIVGVGLGIDGHAYVMGDISGIFPPNEWAKRALNLYAAHLGDCIVAEVNQGGDMVEATIHTVNRRVKVKKVHAKKGKMARAEPVSSLYEQGRVHHVGVFPTLEGQMCTYDPGTYASSPDRLDALVYGVTDLLLDDKPAPSLHFM